MFDDSSYKPFFRNLLLFLFYLNTCIFSTSSLATPTYPEFCFRYAQQAVGQFNYAMSKNMPISDPQMWNGNFQGHRDWCNLPFTSQEIATAHLQARSSALRNWDVQQANNINNNIVAYTRHQESILATYLTAGFGIFVSVILAIVGLSKSRRMESVHVSANTANERNLVVMKKTSHPVMSFIVSALIGCMLTVFIFDNPNVLDLFFFIKRMNLSHDVALTLVSYITALILCVFVGLSFRVVSWALLGAFCGVTFYFFSGMA